MKIKILTFVLITGAASLLAQDMRQNSFSSLFADQKANRIGDAVTILVVESSQASNNAETNTDRSSDLGFNANIKMNGKANPDLSTGIGSNNTFKGSGSTKTTGMIQTKISATIDSVLQNGNLVIKGSRKITINGEEQTIKIKGVIRTADINADNTILSSNISEAEIAFDGNGMINDSQKPGWLTKFLHWIF